MTPDLVAQYIFAVGGPIMALYAFYRFIKEVS